MGLECKIGEFVISNACPVGKNNEWLKADVVNVHTHTSTHAKILVTLSRYENLLGDKVDLAIEKYEVAQLQPELTFSTHSEGSFTY
mgnify:CR=1 FL=1